MNSNIDFVNTNTTKALLKMFLPLMMAMILTMAYSMVDSLWVGNLLGKAGLSALTASTAVVLIINSLSMGIGNGVSVMMDSFSNMPYFGMWSCFADTSFETTESD